MTTEKQAVNKHGINKTATTAAAVAGTLSLARGAYAAGSDEITIALVGCGGRGRGAAVNALRNKSMPNVKLVAMADAFEDLLEPSMKAIENACPGKVDVPAERRFAGLDAYKAAIDCADMALLCTPPGFRPAQFEYAVEKNKISFLEKPVAVDAPGVRRVLEIGKKAEEKGLPVAVGHHLRHEEKHKQLIAKIHEGAIGDVMLMRCFFNSGGVWTRPRKPNQTEMQYQVNNWYYFNWLSGDHIVEQHVHDLDVMNWIAQEHGPAQAEGFGGRQVRISPDHGEIFDHHSIEFTYPSGLKMYSFSRHQPQCWNSFSEHAIGTNGYADMQGHGDTILAANGQELIRWRREADGHQTEHDDLFAAIRDGKPYYEYVHGAYSTLTAIMGRMATYSGKRVSWEQALNSELDLSPAKLAWDADPGPKAGPDGIYPCAMPGNTRAW